MKSATWAILYHSASSDDNPKHDDCPEGKTSWCGWWRDRPKETHPYKHKSPYAPAVVEVVMPTFETLSAELLDHCLGGENQSL